MNLCDETESCREDKNGLSITYSYENSDNFYPAKLLKYGRSCMCFTTEKAIEEGEIIFIMSQDSPLDGINLKIYEGGLARVKECRKINYGKNLSHLICARLVNTNTAGLSSNKFSNGISYFFTK
jgi:hypothetical protein